MSLNFVPDEVRCLIEEIRRRLMGYRYIKTWFGDEEDVHRGGRTYRATFVNSAWKCIIHSSSSLFTRVLHLRHSVIQF